MKEITKTFELIKERYKLYSSTECCSGCIISRKRYTVKNYSSHKTSLIIVVKGSKVISSSSGLRKKTFKEGDIILYPAHICRNMENIPGNEGLYLALIFSFTDEELRNLYPVVENKNRTLVLDSLKVDSAPYSQKIISQVNEIIKENQEFPQLDSSLMSGILKEVFPNHKPMIIEDSFSCKILTYFDQDPVKKWEIKHLIGNFDISERTFRRYLIKEGYSFRSLLREYRLVRALSFLEEGLLPIEEVAYRVGYSNHSQFTAQFQKKFGLLPKHCKSSPNFF